MLNTKKQRTARMEKRKGNVLKSAGFRCTLPFRAGGVGGRTPNEERVTAEAGSAGGDTFLCPSMSATPDLWSPHKAV